MSLDLEMNKKFKISVANYLNGRYDDRLVHSYSTSESIDYNLESLNKFFSKRLRGIFKIKYLSNELKLFRPVHRGGNTRSTTGLYLINHYIITLQRDDINYLKISNQYYSNKIQELFDGDMLPYDKLQAWITEDES